MRQKIKILFLAANPDERTRLELGREFSRIQDALLRSKYRDAFRLLEPEFAARMGNFSSALIKHQPHIVHFCGHGSANQGIVFEGEDRYSRPAGKQELTALFEELNRNARLVFLNACHTKEQAEILGRLFDYTIGANGLILDTDAGKFAGWFYRALADGATVKGAVQAAKSALDNRVSEICELLTREGTDDSEPFISQVLGSLPQAMVGVIFNTNVEDKATVYGGITNMNITGGEAHLKANQTHNKPRRKR